MLTDAQLQIAARNLCLRRGQDPDALIPLFEATHPADVGRPRWQQAAREIKDFEDILDVIRDVKP